MFSSTELISFVFANETDTYYGEDLIKRNLNQYLWDWLHQSYDAVYFLSAEANGFAVHTYGDLRCKEYVPKHKTFLSKLGNSARNEFGSWLQRQLRGKPGETAAFVCPLEDFCSVLDGGQWNTLLAEIAEMKNRTGIFVLTTSATAEKTSRLLLESPVFEVLQETAVTDLRRGAMQQLYGALKNRKGDSCTFLNSFAWERLRAMLLHVIMEFPDRCESCAQLDALTDYLYACVRNPELFEAGGVFHTDMPANYLQYADLYKQLCSGRTWEKFTHACAVYHRQAQCREKPVVRLPILRDRQSYAGRCMTLKLPSWLGQTEDAAEESARLLQGICNAVSAPMNRVENPEMISAAEDILTCLNTADEGDTDTYLQMLGALKFCVENVYTQEKEKTTQILGIVRHQRDLIDVCRNQFIAERDLRLYSKHPAEGKLYAATLRQLQEKLEIAKKQKQLYMDMVSTLELKLKTPFPEDIIQRNLEELAQEIQRFNQPDPEPEIIPNDDDLPDDADPLDNEDPQEDGDYELTDDAFNFHSPNYYT